MSVSKDHEHNHEKIVVRQVIADNPHYDIDAGYKAMTFKVCECGDEKAIDYGDQNKIREKWESRKEQVR